MPNKDECKTIIREVALHHGVSPALISTRLLSAEDKVDMLGGDLPMDALYCAVECWISVGMPDYANGSVMPYKRNLEA